MTYAELVQKIKDYCEVDDTVFTSTIVDGFIENAEFRIMTDVDLDVFRRNSSGTVTSGVKYLTKPDDFLAPFSLSIINSSNNEFLLYKQVTFLQDFTPNPATTGAPKYYADWNDESFLLAPTPDSGYSVELHYFYRSLV